MHKQKQDRNRRDGHMFQGRTRRVVRICGMRVFRRCGSILNVLPAWHNGGTVEPPCDFQMKSSKPSVNKGVPP